MINLLENILLLKALFLQTYKEVETYPNVKLPKLEIKPFDGQPENWHEFWDSFNCTIHQSDISNVQKMTYLKNVVIGSAAATIAGFKLSNENYTQAVTLLHERYDNKQLQVSSHMNNLLRLQPITTLREVDALRDLYNKVETQIRSLENLGIDSTKYGPLLIPVLLSKIPDELNLIISRQFTNDDCWDIVPVLNALKTELAAREKTSFSVEQHSDIEFTAASLYTSVNTKSRRNKDVAITTTPSCIFCNKDHKPHQCTTVTNIDARKIILKNKERCFVCLKSAHIAKQCKSQIKCYKCSG